MNVEIALIIIVFGAFVTLSGLFVQALKRIDSLEHHLSVYKSLIDMWASELGNTNVRSYRMGLDLVRLKRITEDSSAIVLQVIDELGKKENKK